MSQYFVNENMVQLLHAVGLPDEILFHILLFCEPTSLCSLECTSQQFKQLVRDEWLWREKIRNEFPTEFEIYDQEFEKPIYHPAYATFRARWETAFIDMAQTAQMHTLQNQNTVGKRHLNKVSHSNMAL